MTKVKIIEKIYLNPTTIELVTEKPENLHSKIGQFATFEMIDAIGNFRRQYSVSHEEKNSIHFLIKIVENGRAGKIFKNLQTGDEINLVGFFGDFLLQNTPTPKVFIATGTGLSPIYRMMKSIPNVEKKLFLSVSAKNDIFYEKQLRSLPNLELHYFVSRESVENFRENRMTINYILENATIDSEFYLCGNPDMIENMVSGLQKA